MGCSTYLGLGWPYQPLAPGHPISICDIGVNVVKLHFAKGHGFLVQCPADLRMPFRFS